MTEHAEPWQDGERAERYDRQTKIGARLIYAPFAKKIAQSMTTLEDGATIVDVGTGPGLLAIELHKLWPEAKIIGVDPSSEMLRIARENAGRAGMSDFEAKPGTAEEIPLPASSADLVISQSSFHEWEDQQRGLEEISRVLKPGGSLILKDYNRAWLSPWKQKLLGFFHHLHMFQFSFEQVAALLREAGFHEIRGQAKDLQWFLRAEKPQVR
jgi:ubiquinone/menaquinone biosynthesis C-methylase UbiE